MMETIGTIICLIVCDIPDLIIYGGITVVAIGLVIEGDDSGIIWMLLFGLIMTLSVGWKLIKKVGILV